MADTLFTRKTANKVKVKKSVILCTIILVDIRRFIANYNKKTLLALIVLCFLLFYPTPIAINGISIIDPFIRRRVASVGILFLVLRGFVHDYYTSSWALVFLGALILSSTLPFGFIVFLTLAAFIILKFLKKI